MSFSRYPEYKDSGIEWLGDVPVRWEVTALKREFVVVGGSTPKSDNEQYWDGPIVWVTPADLSKLTSFEIYVSQRKITTEGLASCGTTLIPSGSIVLSTRAPIGSLAIASSELCTNQGCKSLVPSERVNSRYYAYLLSNATEELNIRGKGTTFLELSGDELGAFKVVIPPIEEQQDIAVFLDRETGKIDALVAEQEKLIALLKEKRQAVIFHAVTKGLYPNCPMRDSGIEWLGEVPEHWDILPLHRIIQVRRRITYGIVQPGTPDENGRFMVRGQDYSNGWMEPESIFRVSDAIEIPYKRSRLKASDIVMTIVGAGVGNIANVPEWLDGANITQTTARLAVDGERADSRFIAFLLQGPMGKRSVELYAKGAAQPGLNIEHVRIFPITVPPVREQVEIAHYLTQEIAKIDVFAEEAKRAIGLLKERRNALISAAVTGKIKVADLSNGVSS